MSDPMSAFGGKTDLAMAAATDVRAVVDADALAAMLAAQIVPRATKTDLAGGSSQCGLLAVRRNEKPRS
jgi:hypothetical protein